MTEQSVIDQLQDKLKGRKDIVLEQDKLTFNGKSSMTMPNSVGLEMVIKIINNHIANLNRATKPKTKMELIS